LLIQKTSRFKTVYFKQAYRTKEHLDFIKPLLAGENMGLMSEAGCPGVADPGSNR
jgi:16S rRNA (cytidine1402-2'-O)-methyltransferase